MNFDASFRRVANPSTSPPMSAPTSEEPDSTTKSGYLDEINFMLACMEGSFLYESGTLPHDSTGSQPEGGPSTTVATGNMSTNSAYPGLGAPEMTDATALASASATAPPLFTDYGAYTHGFDFLSEYSDSDLSALLAPFQSLANVSAIPPLPGNGIGDQIISPHASEAPASNFMLSSSLYSDAGILPGNSHVKEVSCGPWNGIASTSQPRWDDAETSVPIAIPEIMSEWSWLNHVDANPNTEAPVQATVATTTTGGAGRTGTILGKRARNGSESPRKRGRSNTSWVLEEAEGSLKRIHHTHATRAQQPEEKYIYGGMTRSREARPTAARGLYPYPLSGLSAPQETAASPDQEQIELGPQTRGSTEGRDGLFTIPSNLTERQRLMLRITEGEVQHGAVHVIRCKLCPTVALGSWQCFQRHCNSSEDHPAEFTFCNQCGDYFGRRDSKKRHEAKKNQEGCRTTPRAHAEWKKATTRQLFDSFNVRMEHCLRTGDELGPRFAAIVQERVLCTSKKVFKEKVER
ncbi:hypothetical protein EI94DRAFT_1789386 [Lactarius quietus]|nr:hypothetical protein EI94DRAFT_1789386 [Lactarius quietus]